MIKHMLHITAIAGGLALSLMAGVVHAEGNSGAAIQVNQENLADYRQLASDLGLEYDHEYGYSEWVDAKGQSELGSAGEYEFLDCSNGMQDHGMCDYGANGTYWESVYYSNYDVTLLIQVSSDADSGTSSVNLLKLAEGRHPDLHES
jgi:hypothetical protein